MPEKLSAERLKDDPALNTGISHKAHAIASIAMGVLDVAMAIVHLLATELGVFAILLAAALTTVVRAFVFTAPMAAGRVRGGSAMFFPEIARGLAYLAVVVLIGVAIQALYDPTTWFGFIVCVGLMCVLGTLVNLLLVTAQADRQMAFSALKQIASWRR